jgi:zinc protease
MFLRNVLRFGSLLLLLALASGQPALAQSPSRKLPTIPFEKYKLKNGLEVVLSEDHTLPLVSVNIWYHVGPANEKAGRTGFAHLFEHMMFEGSQHVGSKAHIAYLEGAGATDINGTTNFDRTNYYETIPSNQLELALWLESDRMGYLLGTLDIEKLANQRDVVRNERRQSVENAPYGLAEEALVHLMLPKSHPYYAEVIGSHADVEAAKLEDVREFFQQYYTPNNATMAIVGDFDKSTIKGLVEKYFSSIPAGPAVPKIDVTTPPVTSERRATVTDQVELPRVYMGWITPPVFTAGNAECNFYSQILGGGKSSRLYKSLVYEKQIAQDVATSMEETKLGSLFELIATAKPGVKPEDLEKAIDEVVAKLAAEGPTPAEVERARNLTEAALVRGLQRTNGIANRLNYYNQFLGTPDYFAKDIARFDAVKPADVQRAAQTIFKKDARGVVYAVPGKKVIEDVPKTSEEENKKQAADAGQGKVTMPDETWRANAPKPGPAPKFTLPVPEQAKLSNGLTILLVERHNLPFVSATLYTTSGSELNPLDKPGLSSFVADMLTEGTTNRSALKFAEDADQIGASIAAGAGYSSGTVSLSSLGWNAGSAMDLVSDAALHPAFAEKEVERVRSQRVTAVLQENDEPFALAQRTCVAAGFPRQPVWLFGHWHGRVQQGDYTRRPDRLLAEGLCAFERRVGNCRRFDDAASQGAGHEVLRDLVRCRVRTGLALDGGPAGALDCDRGQARSTADVFVGRRPRRKTQHAGLRSARSHEHGFGWPLLQPHQHELARGARLHLRSAVILQLPPFRRPVPCRWRYSNRRNRPGDARTVQGTHTNSRSRTHRGRVAEGQRLVLQVAGRLVRNHR